METCSLLCSENIILSSLTRILPTRNGNEIFGEIAYNIFSNTDPTYKEWKPAFPNDVGWSDTNTDPTYKEWKPPPASSGSAPAVAHGSYLQGMETMALAVLPSRPIILTRILPTRNGNEIFGEIAYNIFSNTDPTYKEWKRYKLA